MNILFTTVLFAGVYAVSNIRKHLITAATLGGFAFLGIWYSSIVQPTAGLGLALAILSVICQTAFIIYVIILILSSILQTTKVTIDTIYGAVSVYLLIGFGFALYYVLLEILHPGSFYIDDAHNLNNLIDWFDVVYFSFTTLTTLGYGDMTPVTAMARIVSIIEAILGVMYLAILIARFVGIFIAQAMASSKEEFFE